MKIRLLILVVTAMLLFAMSAMAQEFSWLMFLPAITSVDPPPTTVTSAGQIWMDRNLGASQVATSSTDSAAYGNLYQWGRLADGHESRKSPTTSTLSISDIPGHGNFILAPSSPNDWKIPQNNTLWQGVSGTNNPCPTGFRLPTNMEFEIERASWVTNDPAGAFASPLKLVVAGFRLNTDGVLGGEGSGFYWSSTVNDNFSHFLFFSNNNSYVHNLYRAIGFSVRCIKD